MQPRRKRARPFGHRDHGTISQSGKPEAGAVVSADGKVTGSLTIPRVVIVPVQVPDEHGMHPRPVLVSILECPNQIVCLLSTSDLHPSKPGLVVVYTMMGETTILGPISEPVELGRPYGDIINPMLHQDLVHDLCTTECKTIADRRGVLLRLVYETVGMIAKGVHTLGSSVGQHCGGEGSLVHCSTVIPIPSTALALDAPHRGQPSTYHRRFWINCLDTVVGHTQHFGIPGGIWRMAQPEVREIRLIADLVRLDQPKPASRYRLHVISPST